METKGLLTAVGAFLLAIFVAVVLGFIIIKFADPFIHWLIWEP